MNEVQKILAKRELLKEYHNTLTEEEKLAMFMAMFDELEMYEAIKVNRRDDEDDPNFGEVNVYWEATGEDLKEDLAHYLKER